MQINIKDKYEKNVSGKYTANNRSAFNQDFSKKEQSMWNYTLALLKKDPINVVYNSETQKKWLTADLYMFLNSGGYEKFTIDEWFNYLNSK